MGAILGVLIAVEILDELLPGFEGTVENLHTLNFVCPIFPF